MLRVPDIFQSGMILQRGKNVCIWGSAYPGAEITVSIQGQCGKATANRLGTWIVELLPLTASEEETLVVSDSENELVFKDVAVGEVWIGAGQSNMEFWMRYEKHIDEERQRPNNRRIRFYDVPEIAYEGQKQQFDYSRMGRWRTVTRDDIDYFSAVSYYFERVLEEELDVPVGVIGCNWGGTASCVWMGAESVERTGKPWMDAYNDQFANIDMCDYWKNAAQNPMGDTGNPFAVDFNEFILPRTPSPEELKEIFSRSGDNGPNFAVPTPQSIPGSLYEHMVKTVAPYTIRGVLWYQGESDDGLGRQELYKDMLLAVVSDWRKLWQEETLPFLIVQLPGFGSWMGFGAQDWQTIRQCQQEAVDSDENLQLCSISDAGEELDIHPKNKKVVGSRLALLALGHIYGKQILCDAPRLSGVERNGVQIILTFANAEGGLTVQGEHITALSILDEGKEIEYTAECDGERLVVTVHENIGSVRIDFAKTGWYQVNLYNRSGIPAIPFSVEC